MSDQTVSYDIAITPHSAPTRTYGSLCGECGIPIVRVYYSDVEIMGQRKAIVLQSCTCGGERP